MLKQQNEAVRPNFKVWKTIRIGHYKDGNAYRAALSDKHMSITRWADDAVDNIDIAAAETDVDLVRVRGAQLGFTGAARRDAIDRAVLSMGLQRCVPEIGPRLREEYADQPIGEWVIIAMNAVHLSAGHPLMFVVERDDDGLLWLNAFWVIPGHLWSTESQWVFTLPRQSRCRVQPFG